MTVVSDSDSSGAVADNPQDGVLQTMEEGPVVPSSELRLRRKHSVSEAAEASSGGWTAPSPLNLIEMPFRVKDPKHDIYLPEATGWAMDSAGRGPLNQVGSYVGSAILRLATADAGCLNPRTCEGTVYGFKPSSLLTATSSIVGVIGALLMPVAGAIVDHTKYRKSVGVISGILSVGIIGAQISLSQDNWFIMLILDAIQSFTLLVHTTSVFAYLPDLTTDQEIIPHYTAQFNVRQYLAQFVYVTLVIVTGRIRGTDRSIGSSVQTAHDSAGIAFGYGVLFLTYAWTFLFRKRPALSAVPEGSNIVTTGFRQVGKTGRKIWKDYRALKWFMISLLLSPEAGAGVILSIAVTFLTVFMRFSGQDIAKANLVLMTGNVFGSLFAKKICQLINPLNSYRCGLMFLSLSIGLACVVFEGPERRDSVLGFAGAWGFAMGWTYPSQRVLFCTLIPKGQETEMMGLFTFVGSILGWVPSLIFTIMNENGVGLRWGLSLVSYFTMGAATLTLFMGDYAEAVRLVQDDSKEKLQAVIETTLGEPSKASAEDGSERSEEETRKKESSDE